MYRLAFFMIVISNSMYQKLISNDVFKSQLHGVFSRQAHKFKAKFMTIGGLLRRLSSVIDLAAWKIWLLEGILGFSECENRLIFALVWHVRCATLCYRCPGCFHVTIWAAF